MQHIILSSPSCTLPLSLSPNFLSHVAENSIKAVFPLAAVSMTAHTDTMNETLSLLSSIPQSTGEQLAQIYHHQHRTKARCVSRISLQIQNCRQVNHTVSEVAKMQSSPCVHFRIQKKTYLTVPVGWLGKTFCLHRCYITKMLKRRSFMRML